MRNLILGSIVVALAACVVDGGTNRPADTRSDLPPGWVDAQRLASANAAGSEWLTTGGDAGKTHHSRLTQINRRNVDRLGLAWEFDVPLDRVQEATPIVVDGVLYTSGPAGVVFALDAGTGEEIWTYAPDIQWRAVQAACCDLANRGVAVWEGRVYVATIDGVLHALDAADGSVLWQADTVVDRGRGYSSTGAPEVAGDVVVIGNGGAEYDTRGYVTAYDRVTGEQKWRFWTVPRDPDLGPQESPALEIALETWDRESRWDIGGGGTVWDAILYDREFDTLLIGVGNGSPFHNRARSPSGGDNLYLSSIVALDPATGAMKWYYQETPGESWDFTATQPMLLTELEVDGETRPVILHAPKNGFLYVIDRRDGTLLRAEPFARLNWASHVDLETGRPVLTPERADYWESPKFIYPSPPGARNWHPMAWNPDTGLVYMNALDMGVVMFNPNPNASRAPRRININASSIFAPFMDFLLPLAPADLQEQIRALPEMNEPGPLPQDSYLRAIDPLTGEIAWEVEMPGWADRGGVLSTASGLVFMGSYDGILYAFDARTGETLAAIDTGDVIMAAPATYTIDGEQYVVVQTGWGGGGWSAVHPASVATTRGNNARILAFKINGGPVTKPELLPPLEPIGEPPAQTPGVTQATIAEGARLFGMNCGGCHNNQYRSPAPDLRRMSPGSHAAFRQIVLNGVLRNNGMPPWDDVLSQDDVDAIHAYLIDLQAATRAAELAAIAEGRDPFFIPGSTGGSTSAH